MSNITKEINGKEYTFDVTTLDIKLVDYGGFYGTDIRVDVKVKCNNNEDEFSVELCYPMGDAYDYYSEMDYADLAEMFGETAEEIESDFSAWYDKHSDKLETDYVNLFIDECFWEDEEPFQEMVLDELLSDKSDNKDELLALIVSDSDEITTIETDEDSKQLYYTVYLDDEPLVFDTQDYPSLKEETTEIPYLFNDQENIVYYAGALNVKTFVEGIDSIGVQLIYKGGGEVRKSAISYVSAKDEEDVDGIDNIGANASKFVSTVFTDLSGRKVARPAKGVYIQTVRKADGTVKSVKRVFK